MKEEDDPLGAGALTSKALSDTLEVLASYIDVYMQEVLKADSNKDLNAVAMATARLASAGNVASQYAQTVCERILAVSNMSPAAAQKVADEVCDRVEKRVNAIADRLKTELSMLVDLPKNMN